MKRFLISQASLVHSTSMINITKAESKSSLQDLRALGGIPTSLAILDSPQG